MWIVKSGLQGGPVVSLITGRAVASDGRDDAGAPIDPANQIVLHLDDQQVAVGIEANFVRLIQHCLTCLPAVTGITSPAVSSHRRHLTLWINAQHAMGPDTGDEDGAVGSALDAKGKVHRHGS